MPKSTKVTAKKAPMTTKKLAPKAAARKTVTAARKTETHAANSGFMWKLLKEKEEQHKLHDKKQSETHVKMHENSPSGDIHKTSGFSRFAGPRRKAAG